MTHNAHFTTAPSSLTTTHSCYRLHVTGIQLSHFLENRGLNVLSCDLLTKYEQSRSLAYNVSIKSCHFEKAQNPEVWPYRVVTTKTET